MSATTAPAKPKSKAGITLARAEKTATEDLKREVAEIRSDISSLTADNIKTRWRIGHRIRAILDDTTGKYGKDPRAEIDALMPLSRDSLRPMIKLAENYEEKDIDLVLTYKHPVTGEGTTWSHLAAVSRVKDKDAALGYVHKAVTKGWSSKDLVDEIVRDNGGPKSKGGRKPARADSLASCLSAIDEKALNVINAAKGSWLPAGGISDLYDQENITPGTVTMLDKVLSNLYEMTIQVRLVVAELESKVHQARATLRTNSQLQKDV